MFYDQCQILTLNKYRHLSFRVGTKFLLDLLKLDLMRCDAFFVLILQLNNRIDQKKIK